MLHNIHQKSNFQNLFS